MFKFLFPAAAVIALFCSPLALAEDTQEEHPLPPSILKCYESVEVDSQMIDCTNLEADYWESQINVLLRHAMTQCSRWGRSYEEHDPTSNFTARCQSKLQEGYEAWFGYKQAMMATQCSVRPDSWLDYECAVIRSRLAKEYHDTIYDFYRLYPNN